VAKGKKKSPAKTSWLRRLRRNKGQLLFLILGLLVVISMIVSLIVVALPQPVLPTPTPTPAALLWAPAGTFPWLSTALLPFAASAGA